MAIAEISVVPIGTESASLSKYVVECVKVLEGSHLTHEMHGMGTIVEGELEDLLPVLLKVHEAPFQAGALRVVSTIKIDDRRDRKASAKDKVKAVRDRMSPT